MFYIFNSISGAQFYSPDTSVSTVLLYYHILLYIYQNKLCPTKIFLGSCFLKSFCFGSYVGGKVFFWVVQTPLIPVWKYTMSTSENIKCWFWCNSCTLGGILHQFCDSCEPSSCPQLRASSLVHDSFSITNIITHALWAPLSLPLTVLPLLRRPPCMGDYSSID